MRTGLVQRVRSAGAILGALLAITCHAAPMNVHLAGMVPLTTSADDFHIRVVIDKTFLLGEPINLLNGPWSTDGVTTTNDTGFSVDWAGAGVTAGGPYPFGFDFLVNTTDYHVTEAYWTVGGVRSEVVPTTLFNLVATPANLPEPSSLALLVLACALLHAQRLVLRRRAALHA